MTTAPIPLTEDVLGTRQAKTMVMLSTEERLNMKVPAYVSSDSEISFLVRQPSSSAILVNQPYIELQVKFTLTQGDGTAVNPLPHYLGGFLGGQGAAKAYGRQLEGLPFLSKCVRTSVVTINGASNTFRNSEYFVPYLRSIVGRDAMAKIGTPWNDFEDQYPRGVSGHMKARDNYATVLSRVASKQARLFDMSVSCDGALAQQNAVTYTMTFREPLFFSIFNGLSGNSLWPVWCSEQNKSPSVLHAQQMSINFNLHDNWAQNLFGMIQNDGDNGAAEAKISAVSIDKAHLCCTFVQPPPKYIAASLSANVTYQTAKFMRFKAKCTDVSGPVGPAVINHRFPDYACPNETLAFTLEAVNFQYMPSIFMIEVGPDYNEKLNYIAAGNAAARQHRFCEMSKEDRRMGITSLNLIVNTSPDIAPTRGSGHRDASSIVNIRYSARQLYDMYLKNCASVERAIYDFDTWFNKGCCILISSADMNGILPSCHIRGNVSIQGSINVVNTLGYKAYVGVGTGAIATDHANPALASFARYHNNLGYVWVIGQKFEKFECSITGVYSNSYMALDAKSGIVGESVMSEQYGNGMRLSTGQ